MSLASKLLQRTLPNVQQCTDLAKAIVSKFVMISVPGIEKIIEQLNSESSVEMPNIVPKVNDLLQQIYPEVSSLNNSVYFYAVEFQTMGALWYGFCDSVWEGNAERIMQYWKIFDGSIQTADKAC